MKRNLLKAIGICFLIFVVLSWIIPTGSYSGEGAKFTTGSINAIGLFDLIGVPASTFVTFALYVVVFCCIGGLYGVMHKTGALDALVEKICKKKAGKEKRFLICTIIFFAVLSSLTGLMLPLFALVPLFAMIFARMNVDKVASLAATVGAILVGSMASTYGFNISGYTKNILFLDMNDQIIAKVILLVLLTTALILFVVKFNAKKEVKAVKKEATVKKVETKKVEPKKAAPKKAVKTTKKPAKRTTKATTKNMAISKDVKKVNANKGISTLPLVIIFALMMIVSLFGMYNWYYAFGIEAFSNLHSTIMGVKIHGFPIFENLLSGINALGYWGNNEFVIMMVLAAIVIAFIYRLSINEFVESFIAGIKKMMPTALYAALASVILSVLYQASYQGTGTITETMFHATMTMTGDFNVLTTGLTALYGSFFYNDLYYLLYSLQTYISGFSSGMISIAGLLSQSMYSLAMILLPTSAILIAGLSYFDVSYKKWIKYIWKFAVVAALIILLVCCILTLI